MRWCDRPSPSVRDIFCGSGIAAMSADGGNLGCPIMDVGRNAELISVPGRNWKM
jgi:hypothetical protein